MKSSDGRYFIALDQVRALAAFMVFTWHFIHAGTGFPVPFGTAPGVFPFSLLDEGHVGVALFMTLSGYLFAKILDGRLLLYWPFVLNRVLRLAPLLILVVIVVGIRGQPNAPALFSWLWHALKGAPFEAIPNGGWSVAVEFHFYLLLPLLLWLSRRARLLPLAVVVLSVALRAALFYRYGQIQHLAFGTLVGRVDQFVLGIVCYGYRREIAHRQVLAVCVFFAFSAFYWWFDRHGGYNHLDLPSRDAIWIVLPTIEAFACAFLLAYYDSTFTPTDSGTSKVIASIGTYSYSIYLLHFFYVFAIARFIQQYVMDISNFYIAVAWSAVAFVATLPLAALSYHCIERPFLRLRLSYTKEPVVETSVALAAASPPHVV